MNQAKLPQKCRLLVFVVGLLAMAGTGTSSALAPVEETDSVNMTPEVGSEVASLETLSAVVAAVREHPDQFWHTGETAPLGRWVKWLEAVSESTDFSDGMAIDELADLLAGLEVKTADGGDRPFPGDKLKEVFRIAKDCGVDPQVVVRVAEQECRGFITAAEGGDRPFPGGRSKQDSGEVETKEPEQKLSGPIGEAEAAVMPIEDRISVKANALAICVGDVLFLVADGLKPSPKHETRFDIYKIIPPVYEVIAIPPGDYVPSVETPFLIADAFIDPGNCEEGAVEVKLDGNQETVAIQKPLGSD